MNRLGTAQLTLHDTLVRVALSRFYVSILIALRVFEYENNNNDIAAATKDVPFYFSYLLTNFRVIFPVCKFMIATALTHGIYKGATLVCLSTICIKRCKI